MRIGFDLDGVGFNFGESVRRYLEHTGQGHLWKSGPNPTPYWNFYEDWGWDLAQFVKFCNEGADAGFIFCGDAREGFPEAVQYVKSLGHTVVIITDRGFGSTPAVSHKHTRDWLAQHDIPYDELYFSRDKTIASTDMFVEDKIENYDALDAAGTEVWLINRPWNQVEDNRRRLPSVMAYAHLVALKTQFDKVFE